MITITTFHQCFWRNRHAQVPVAEVGLDTAGAAAWRIDDLGEAALAAIGNRFPAVRQRLYGPTAAGFLAALCLSVQREKFDLPPAAGAAGERFWFAALDSFHALALARLAVALLNRLVGRPPLPAAAVAAALGHFEESNDLAVLDQSTRAMLAVANARGIPWFRIDQGLPDVQLGQGRNQRRMRETLSSREAALATAYASNKALACTVLSAIGLPVGRFGIASNPEDAAKVAGLVGFPVVLKPTYGSKGRGVVIGLASPQAVAEAARKLLSTPRQLLIQSVLPGDDHRLLVVSGRLIAAARRYPAAVVGDGQRTVRQLIEATNRDPRRGVGFTRLMSLIEIDDELVRVLAGQGLTLSSIVPTGVQVRLRLTANISTGGTAADVTDSIHPDNARLAERAALAIGLMVAGVDFITPDITRSWREVGGGICEVNSTVGLGPHWIGDPSRDVVRPIFDLVFPPGSDGRVPTALVAGPRGSTAARMLGHILRAAGHVVGRATADGIAIGDETVATGNFASARGAHIALRDPTVSAAVLEATADGIDSDGLYVDRCDAAAVLSIAGGAADTVVRAMRKVAETARKAVAFNADDRACLAMARDFPVDRAILFSRDPSASAVLGHVAAGGTAVTPLPASARPALAIRRRAGDIAVPTEAGAFLAASTAEEIVPALAAVALAHGMDVPAETIAAGLASFAAGRLSART